MGKPQSGCAAIPESCIGIAKYLLTELPILFAGSAYDEGVDRFWSAHFWMQGHAMKSPMKVLLVALALMAGCTGAWAHGHGHFGFFVGPVIGPYWGPWGYPPVVVERSSPVYVDSQPVVVEAAPASNYWYFCRAANGYYPYVKDCPAGWEKVMPTPPSGR
jgi:hypothetical protein